MHDTNGYPARFSQDIGVANHPKDLIRATIRKLGFSRRDEKSKDFLHKLQPESKWKDKLPRYLTANIGGATLLIPMIIMSFL